MEVCSGGWGGMGRLLQVTQGVLEEQVGAGSSQGIKGGWGHLCWLWPQRQVGSISLV